MDDRTLEMTLLYDFYGELLTDKQREYFDLYHNEDLSLSEIAENVGITRQGVYDIISRAEASLSGIEAKTGLIRRFSDMQEKLAQAELLAKTLKTDMIGGAPSLFDELLGLLSELKG